MRLFKIQFGYIYDWGSDDEASKEKKSQQRQRRAELCRDLRIEVDRRAGRDDIDWGHPNSVLVNDQQLLHLTIAGEEFKIESEIPVPEEDQSHLPQAVKKLTRLVHKLLESPMNDPEARHVFNDHVQVHVPGAALVTFNDTLLLEDSCTDALQESLNAGWRIIAVCPQSQRRPDYILGRYRPDRDICNTRAQRSSED